MKPKIDATETKAGKGYLWRIYVNDSIQRTKIVTRDRLTKKEAINKYLSIVYHP